MIYPPLFGAGIFVHYKRKGAAKNRRAFFN